MVATSTNTTDEVISLTSLFWQKNQVLLGYDPSKVVLIPNRFDIKALHVSVELVAQFKRTVFIADGDFVNGCCDRLSHVKSQNIFVKAAGIISQKFPGVKFLMVGLGLEKAAQVAFWRL